MKTVGGGKRKGGAFERKVCKALSRWVSRGRREDLFWRSAMSGGRATLGLKQGKDLRYQAGDITATHRDGQVLTDYWYIECKHVKRFRIDAWMLGAGSPLAKFWRKAVIEAAQHERHPMLIAKTNLYPVVVLIDREDVDAFAWARQAHVATVVCDDIAILDYERMLKSQFSCSMRRVRVRVTS